MHNTENLPDDVVKSLEAVAADVSECRGESSERFSSQPESVAGKN